jgi:hypothetical protein
VTPQPPPTTDAPPLPPHAHAWEQAGTEVRKVPVIAGPLGARYERLEPRTFVIQSCRCGEVRRVEVPE